MGFRNTLLERPVRGGESRPDLALLPSLPNPQGLVWAPQASLPGRGVERTWRASRRYARKYLQGTRHFLSIWDLSANKSDKKPCSGGGNILAKEGK